MSGKLQNTFDLITTKILGREENLSSFVIRNKQVLRFCCNLMVTVKFCINSLQTEGLKVVVRTNINFTF